MCRICIYRNIWMLLLLSVSIGQGGKRNIIDMFEGKKTKSLLFGFRLQRLVDCAKDLSCILKIRVEIIICFGTFNIVYVHHFGSLALLWFRVFIFEIYVCVSLVAYIYIYTHIKCMLYACAFPFLFACTSYIYIHHTYNKKSRVTYTILYNCCCVIITYFNTIYGCSLYRQLSCVHIYIYKFRLLLFVRLLARSFARLLARAHIIVYICVHVYCNKRAASECVRTFWQTLNLRQIFLYSYK